MKKACERHQNLSKEEKEESDKMVANDMKISLKMKNKGWLSIEKIIMKSGKTHITFFLVMSAA